MSIDEKLLEQLKSQHGSAYLIPVEATKYDEAIDIVVKRPPRAEWKRFRAMLFDDAQKPEAMEQLAKSCVVHPSSTDFAALLNDRPALAEKIGSVLTELAGGGGQAEAKKL